MTSFQALPVGSIRSNCHTTEGYVNVESFEFDGISPLGIYFLTMFFILDFVVVTSPFPLCLDTNPTR